MAEAKTTETGAAGTKTTESSKVASGEAVKSPAQMEQERSAKIAKATEDPEELEEALDASQTEEEKRQQLRAVAPTPATAAGAEKLRLTGEKETPKGKDRGSQAEIVGGAPKSDYPKGPSNKPVGLQAEASAFAPNGSLEPNMMPSPSGPIPAGAAGAFAMNPALLTTARQREGLHQSAYEALTDEQIETVDPATLRQVAADRGYNIDRNVRGARSIRALFAQSQKDDKLLKRSRKSKEDEE